MAGWLPACAVLHLFVSLSRSVRPSIHRYDMYTHRSFQAKASIQPSNQPSRRTTAILPSEYNFKQIPDVVAVVVVEQLEPSTHQPRSNSSSSCVRPSVSFKQGPNRQADTEHKWHSSSEQYRARMDTGHGICDGSESSSLLCCWLPCCWMICSSAGPYTYYVRPSLLPPFRSLAIYICTYIYGSGWVYAPATKRMKAMLLPSLPSSS